MSRFRRWSSAVLVVAATLSACGSDSPDDSSDAADTTVEEVETTDEATNDTEAEIPATAAASDDFCATVPDAAAIENTIGVAVKDPVAVGDPASSVTCTYLRAADDFPGISFHTVQGQTIAEQTAFAKQTFNIDITPIEGSDGFYLGEGSSVYYELDGNLYQTQATINEMDPATAATLLMRVWLGI